MAWWMAVVACVQQVTTGRGELVVQAPDLKALGENRQTAPMLVGTHTCPDVACRKDCPIAHDPLACFEVSGTDPVSVDNGCWTFDAPGSGAVLWHAVSCPANAEGYSPNDDRLLFDVLAANDVTAAVFDFEQASEDVLDPGPAGAFPDDWAHRDDRPWTLVAGTPFSFFPWLVAPDGREVGWTIADAVAEVVPVDGPRPEAVATDGRIAVTVADGATADVLFGVGDDRWPLATVTGVPADTIESLEVVVGYALDPLIGPGPVGARAVARDAAGGVVWGAPVVWSLDEGLLALDHTPGLPGRDYLVVLDRCTPPSENGGPHTAVLRATLGDLTDTAAIVWDVPVGLPDLWFEASSHCVEGEPFDPGTTDPSTTGTGTPTEPGPPEVTPDDEPSLIRVVGGCSCDTGGGPGWLAAVGASLLFRRKNRRSNL